LLKKNPNDIICGPNIDLSTDFGSFVANAIQSIYISEGLKTHSTKKRRQVDFHNIPLNNCAMNKKIFNRVGGFNEKVDYYLDDVEFFYICHKLKYKFIQYPELTIQHHCRKFPLDYLKYKFYARKKIGYNAFFFPELYAESIIIKLVFLSFLITPVSIYLFLVVPKLFLFMVLLYFSIVILFSLRMMSKKWKYAPILPLGMFFSHVANYCGFACGLLKGLANFNKYEKIKNIKEKRYAVFQNN